MSAVIPYGEKYISAPKGDDAAKAAIARCVSGSSYSHGVRYMINMPSEEDREVLRSRLKYLTSMLGQDKAEVLLRITQMLQALRSQGVGADEDDLSIANLYLRELQLEPRVPTWAAALACADVRFGRAPGINVAFKLNTPLLRRLCDSYVWDVRAEIQAIEQILAGAKHIKVVTDEERKVVSEGLASLEKEFSERHSERAPLVPIAEEIGALVGTTAFDELPDADGGARKIAHIPIKGKKRAK